MKWAEFTYQAVCDYCNNKGSRTFTLQEFYRDTVTLFEKFRPDNLHIEAKIRQQLQLLRNEGLLTFVDNRGTYTLRGLEFLRDEVEDNKIVEIKLSSPEKREHLIEIYARDIGWVSKAKEKYGYNCMYSKCENTFTKQNGEPYIEVHHIIPLCQGGEDGIWNLAVLCAHHHRMAHYADNETRQMIENMLLQEVQCRI